MDRLLSRPYAGYIDLRPVLELVRTCRAVEDSDPWPPIAEVRQHLRAKGNTPAADTQVWLSRAGALAAVAILWGGATLISYIHPQEPRDDLAARMLAWATAHARALARRRGERATLLVPVYGDDHRAAALLERNRLVAQDWSILRMARSLADPVPPPHAPPGFTLRTAAGPQERAAIAALYSKIFVSNSSIVQDRLALGRTADDIHVLDLVAVAPDSTLAAFCLCLADTPPGTQHDRHEGWIDWLGTHPAYRQRGLGHAILRASLQQLQELGVNVALLGTASWNVKAQHLFESEGFRLLRHVRWFAWEEDA